MTPIRCAIRRFVWQETKYDRRILQVMVITLIYVAFVKTLPIF